MPEATDPAKFKANMAAIKKVKLQTLSEFKGKPRKPAVKTVFPPYGKAEDTYAHHFLPVMQFVFNHTTFDPNNEMDQKALAALSAVGVKPGKTYHASRHGEIDGQQLAKAFGKVAKEQLALWNDPKKAAPFLPKLFQPKGHMTIEAMVLQSAVGPLGQPADQAMYPGIATTDGKPMNAQHDYVIRMTKAELPPAIAFWSLTLYDAKHGFFIPNKEKKYSVGQNAGMKLNASGGIEVYVAAKQPKDVPAENWLPITREDLDLDVIMRVYQPDLEKMKTWKAPKAERVDFAAGTSPAAPGAKSSQSLEYELALQRGTQVVIWGLPAVSMKSFCGSMQTQLGARENDIVYFSKPMVSRHGFLTANNNVPYVAVCLNTKGGPVVLDVPAASKTTMYFGSILDLWQTPIADVGPTGDDKGKGGKYLFLPPGYKGTVPEGYLVYRPDTYTVPVALRPVSRPGGTLEEAVAYAKTLRAYSLKDAANPPAGRYIDVYPKAWDTLPVYDETFFEKLAEVINEEPVLERDLAMMDFLWSIGIRKGQPFKPEGEVARALKQAVKTGYDILQDRFITPGGALRPYGSGTQWLTFNLSKTQAEKGFPFVTPDRLLVDDRGLLYFWITFMPHHLGGGSYYMMGLRDKNGDLFDGKSLYRLRVPRDVPARNFWSAIAYSMKTKGFIPNTKPVGLSSQDKNLKANADGTHDIYFGPKPPKGMESNWVQTGEDFFLIFRLYGPGKSALQQTWVLNDVEKVQ
jgi:hypothetical protein